MARTKFRLINHLLKLVQVIHPAFVEAYHLGKLGLAITPEGETLSGLSHTEAPDPRCLAGLFFPPRSRKFDFRRTMTYF
jgi:hypothetical protein